MAIRDALAEVKLDTSPDFDDTHIDASITFVPAPPSLAVGSHGAVAGVPAQGAPPDADIVDLAFEPERVDPSYRVARLRSARTPPVAVNPDTTIAEAVTLMMKHDFSQLAVISGGRTVKGVVSWKSLGKRLAMGKKCETVGDAMEPVNVIELGTSLFEAVALIAKNDCVLVKDETNQPCGIITSYDVSETFVELGEPFLLLGEIENLVRDMMDGRFSEEELEKGRDPLDADRPISKVSDLNFGGYVRILQDPAAWVKVGTRLDRGTFVTYLERVREIRNDTMHFDPDGVDVDDRKELRDFAGLLKQVKQLG